MKSNDRGDGHLESAVDRKSLLLGLDSGKRQIDLLASAVCGTNRRVLVFFKECFNRVM